MSARIEARNVSKRILKQGSIHSPELFSKIKLSAELTKLLARKLESKEVIQLNRLLIEESYSGEIKPSFRGLRGFDMNIGKHLGRDRVEYVMEPKVDGVSLSVHYRKGKLVLGVTRGDGVFGDDITVNLRTVRAIPLELAMKNPPELLEVRGEAYMAIKDFEALNAKLAAAGEKTLPNARNATAGTLKLLDPKLVAQRPVNAVFYAVGACEGIEFETHAESVNGAREFWSSNTKKVVALQRHRGGLAPLP